VFIISLSSVFVDEMVQGSAYGDERRFALRTPVPHMAPGVIAWAAFCGALVGGTVLLASKNFVAGVPVVLIGLFLARSVPQRLHRLARRWLVIVPAGIVVHDHMVLGETLMVMRKNIKSASVIAQAGETADFTGGVAGNRIAIHMLESDKVVLSDITAKILGTTIALHVTAFSFAPRRINAALTAITQ
jgi:xanthosine utilization system XapX-like protein